MLPPEQLSGYLAKINLAAGASVRLWGVAAYRCTAKKTVVALLRFRREEGAESRLLCLPRTPHRRNLSFEKRAVAFYAKP
jgi:hypothetical protein